MYQLQALYCDNTTTTSFSVPLLSSARKNNNCKEYFTAANKGKDDLKSCYRLV